jgi:hypothetical protein
MSDKYNNLIFCGKVLQFQEVVIFLREQHITFHAGLNFPYDYKSFLLSEFSATGCGINS